MAANLHTFVVPAYGQSAHLEACIASLQAQTVPSRVLISTSTPSAWLDALAARMGIAVHAQPGAGGIGRDWNAALACADTRWVTLAHQDDLYLPRFTEASMALADAVPDAVLLLTGYAERLADGSTRRNSPMLAVKRLLLELGFANGVAARSVAARMRALRFGCPIPCPSVTLCKDTVGSPFREDLKVNLDWDAWSRLAAGAGAFAYDREVLMLHRIHGGSETSAGIRDGVRAREDLMMFERFWPKLVARLLARAYAMSYEAPAR